VTPLKHARETWVSKNAKGAVIACDSRPFEMFVDNLDPLDLYSITAFLLTLKATHISCGPW
jgi:hypothetical protein